MVNKINLINIKKNSKSYSAVEALAVVVVVQSLNPSVTGLNREAAGHALRREQLIPICEKINHFQRYCIFSL
jgi:hypothetical protein